jgi:endoglucanase
LNLVGVQKARGFSLNVANFYSTAEQVTYGEAVSKLLGGTARYVIDTSRNGRGPAPAGPLSWCDPAGRALGTSPTAITGGAHADALLWIKHPGESDGDCGRSEPAAGMWFNSYAVSLVKLR